MTEFEAINYKFDKVRTTISKDFDEAFRNLTTADAAIVASLKILTHTIHFGFNTVCLTLLRTQSKEPNNESHFNK